MVDWKSPTVIARASAAFDKFMHLLLGVYLWEWVISLDFDWEYITRKRRFRWPMIFYFLNRYFIMFSLVGIVIALDVTSPINCQALYTFNTVIGASAIGLASINLSLRTMAVWSGQWYIVIPLIALILGHYALLLQVVTLTATWVTGTGCVITYTDNRILMATFIYTITFDFVILSLTAVKLFMSTTATDSRLRNLIFKDGLSYFIIAFLSNLLATVFILLDLNPVMSVIANIPAVVLTCIVACRVVRRMNNYSAPGQETFSTCTQFSSVAFRSYDVYPSVSLAPKDGNHVESCSSSTLEPNTTVAAAKYRAAGQVGRNDSRNPEPQAIQGEVNGPPIVLRP